MTSHLVAVLGRGVIPPDSPAVTADDLGFSRGDGCFDSARVIGDNGQGRVVGLDAHLDRLERSAAAMEIASPSRQAWIDLVKQAMQAWSAPGEATMKFYLTRGREWDAADTPLAMVTVSERPSAPPPGADPLARSLRVTALSCGHPSDAFVHAPWLLGGVKTLSYATQMAIVREAKRRGVDDAILVTTDGYALEGTTSGLIAVIDGVVCTTPTEGTGILRSTTVDVILQRAHEADRPTAVRLISLNELFNADGVFLVSSSRGPCPVIEIDGQKLTVDKTLARNVAADAGF